MSTAIDATDPSLQTLVVRAKRMLTPEVAWFELARADGTALPAFSAGAHLTVQTPSGAMRQYSLCGDPEARDRYELAILRERSGRGGSRSMVDDLHEGQPVQVRPPENAFALSDKARQFLFVAGGIGITPLLAMMKQLTHEGLRSFKLIYLTRDAEHTPFLDALTAQWPDQVRIHHSASKGRMDLWPVFEKPTSGTHIHCCGPRGLIDEVLDMTGHWPSGSVHVERFGVDTQPRPQDHPFEVQLRSGGEPVRVEVGQSILEALRARGVRVLSSCESGTCGSCKVRYLAGEVDHRDMVLMPQEQGDHLMACVSRARSGTLVLDL